MAETAAQHKYVAYYRVSTSRQGISGLGLDAQRTAVEAFLRNRAGRLVADFTEVQSGKADDRPQLQEALKLCRLTNSTLLVGKIDRLSRSVAFLSALQRSGMKFVAADMPEANELVVHILAAVAENERNAIAARTRSALAQARARGTKLGNPRLRPGDRSTALVAAQANSQKAMDRASELREVIEHAQQQGCTTLTKLAEHLNGLGVTTAQGQKWYPNSVRRVLQRLCVSTPEPGTVSNPMNMQAPPSVGPERCANIV